MPQGVCGLCLRLVPKGRKYCNDCLPYASGDRALNKILQEMNNDHGNKKVATAVRKRKETLRE